MTLPSDLFPCVEVVRAVSGLESAGVERQRLGAGGMELEKL